MFHRKLILSGLAAAGLVLAACQQAAPAPTAAPAKPAATTAPAAKPTTAPAASPAASPSPAAKPAASPVASPSPAAAAKPAATAPTETFDEKAVADFYTGKTVKIVVGFSPGGGFDTYARAIARYIGKHIPGNPTVIVENQPGAGSMLAANNLAQTQPKDGTVIGHFIGGIILQQFLGNPGAQFDASKFNYVGAPTPDSGVCVVRKDAGITNLAQLRGRAEPLVTAGTAAGSNTDDIPNVLSKLLGLNIKHVSGFPGTSDMRLAIDRGEAQAGCWGWESMSVTYADALKAGEVIPVGQAGDEPYPDLPNVPMFRDLAQNDQQRLEVHYGIDAPAVFNRPFVLPPGTPADRVAALRKAFQDTMKDPDFLAEAKKSNLVIRPITGERVTQLVTELFQMPANIKDELKGILLATG